MNHSCYENVGSSKQTSHPTPVLHIQRQQRQHTKATRVITVLFTIAASLHGDVWMLIFHVVCKWYLSKFFCFSGLGSCLLFGSSRLCFKSAAFSFLLHPLPQFTSFHYSGISIRAQRPTIWYEFSVPPGLCFPLVV